MLTAADDNGRRSEGENVKVLITGGGGFLGQRLLRRLLQQGTLAGPQEKQDEIEEIVVFDRAVALPSSDRRVRSVTGDLCEESLMRELVDGVGSVFHLAAVVSGQAEADFDLGMRVNVDGARILLEACRRAKVAPRVIFTSSVAVYGGNLPPCVDDATALEPRSSYGAQKAIAELLLGDYSRKGFVDGRVARVPTVSVRPGRPNKAASSFASSIVREPLHGETAVCPVAPETRMWLLSPRRAIECLVALHDLPGATIGANRKVNLPGVSVSAAEMVDTLRSVAGNDVAARVRWEPDPAVERIVGTWPAMWDTGRARGLGLEGDAGFAAIVRAFMEDDMQGGT